MITTISASACRCKTPWCPICAPTWSRALRRRLDEAAPLTDNTNPILITLTLARTPWRSPHRSTTQAARAAYDHVSRSRALPKTMRALSRAAGHTRWLARLELHADGWPHWHVVAWLPPTAPPPDELADIIAQTWALGFTHVRPTDHAATYATKYATKAGTHPPDWAPPRIRAISTSRGFWPSRRARHVRRTDAPPPRRSAHLLARCATCSQRTRITIRKRLSPTSPPTPTLYRTVAVPFHRLTHLIASFSTATIRTCHAAALTSDSRDPAALLAHVRDMENDHALAHRRSDRTNLDKL